MKNIVFYIVLFIVLLMHTIGLYGILFSAPRSRNDYIELSWMNLLVTGICFLTCAFTERLSQKQAFKKYLTSFLLIGLAGFAIEVIGVKTGKIFGTYYYGDRLGYRFLEVPLVIGLNWAILVFSVAAIISRLKFNHWTKAWIGATLLVMLDLLIEPIAMRFFYWTWDIKTIPVQNFIAWWIVSFLMLLFCFRFAGNLHNRLGIYVYLIQVIFFGLLHLLLK